MAIEVDRIYQEDCLQTLRRMEDNSVDLIITSPPYNKGYYNKHKRQGKGDLCRTKSRAIQYDGFNDKMDPLEYEKWQKEIIAECLRVLKPTGSFFYNHKDILFNNSTIHPRFVYDFPIKQVLIWDRGSTLTVGKDYFYPTTEYIFQIKKTDASKPYFNRKEGRFKSAVWRFSPERNNNHPAPFPIELPENCILACSKEGDLIYDPFMGSGTTAVAAKKHNRHYIGSELSEEYVRQAEERLRKVYN